MALARKTTHATPVADLYETGLPETAFPEHRPYSPDAVIERDFRVNRQ